MPITSLFAEEVTKHYEQQQRQQEQAQQQELSGDAHVTAAPGQGESAAER